MEADQKYPKEKRALEQPFSSHHHFSIFLYIITETHIQTRKLRAVSVFVSYPPFFNSIFRQANTPFSQNRQYPTPFYLSVLYYHGNPRLLRESILLPASTQIPMASFGNSRLCRCEIMMTLPLFTPPNSTFDKRDLTKSPCAFTAPMLFYPVLLGFLVRKWST